MIPDSDTNKFPQEFGFHSRYQLLQTSTTPSNLLMVSEITFGSHDSGKMAEISRLSGI